MLRAGRPQRVGVTVHFNKGRLRLAFLFSAPGARDYLYAGLSSLGAVALAGVALFHQRLPALLPRAFTRRAGAVLWAIRGLNSGRVGDYVAWVAVGVTVFGGAFAITML